MRAEPPFREDPRLRSRVSHGARSFLAVTLDGFPIMLHSHAGSVRRLDGP